MRAIVLSGGGSKGAYQIGVWKALRKLNISYDIVTGTSVGALNGALMVQQNYQISELLWENINFNMIFDKDIENNPHTFEGMKELLQTYVKAVTNGGMKIKPLEQLIRKYLDLEQFYNSNIKYGLTTINLSDFKPLTLTKKEIPRDHLVDYLIASATCFPFFEMKKINQDYYIDGGYFDNLPIDLAISLGATEVIAVDIGGKKLFSKEEKKYSVPVTYIRPKNNIGNFLVFDKKTAIKNIQYGYLDTMKVFKKLDGNQVTFYKKEYQNLQKHVKKGISEGIHRLCYYDSGEKYKFILENNEKQNDIIVSVIDYLGINLDLDLTKIYTKKQFLKEVKNKYHHLQFPTFLKLQEIIEKHQYEKLMNKGYLLKYGTLLLQLLGEKFYTQFSTEIFASFYLKYLVKE